jgi:hypothetical protein
MKDKKRIQQLPSLDERALSQVHGGWPPDPIAPIPVPVPSLSDLLARTVLQARPA